MQFSRRHSVARALAALSLTFAVACGGASNDGADATDSTMGSPSSPETMGGTIATPGTDVASKRFKSTNGHANLGGGSGSNDANTGAAPAPAPAADPSANDPAPAPSTDPAPAPATDPAPAATTPVTAPMPSTKALYVPPECGADCRAHDVPGVIARMSKKYNIPRWFYFAIIRRESSFDRCKTQPENADNRDYGRGLTQITWGWYAGVPYPQHLASPDNSNADWRNNMGLSSSYGAWIDMNDVTPIPSTPATDCYNNPKADDAYDPATNLDRFSSGFAAPAYHLYHSAGESPTETLRKVAYHWHYGLWNSWTGAYPSDPRPYLSGTYGYDAYVSEYKGAVEADDGVWSGPTCKPPYAASGC